MQARVQLLGDRPELGVARGAQPQLDPQHPVLGQRRGRRQALLDHRLQPLGVRGSGELVLARDPGVAGVRVGVVERLSEQGVAGVEVVVDERGRDARLHRDPGDPHAVDPLAGDLARRPRRGSARGRSACDRSRGHGRVGGIRIFARSARTRSANHATASLPARQRAAPVTARVQTELDVPDQVDVLLEHERVQPLVEPLDGAGARSAARRAVAPRTRRGCARSRPGPSATC